MSDVTNASENRTSGVIREREDRNRLYHNEQRARFEAEHALADLLVVAERLGLGLNPAYPAVVRAREVLSPSAISAEAEPEHKSQEPSPVRERENA